MDLQGAKRIAAISDIHANARALEAAMDRLHDLSPDVVLILGDILTYGCEPQAVLDLLSLLGESLPTHFVIGNHDQIYRDIDSGVGNWTDTDGPLGDSIRWTISQVGTAWVNDVVWHRELLCGEVLFSHANPFGPDDWTYLNSATVAQRALRKLDDRRIRLGIFGHTHRRRIAQTSTEVLDLQPTQDAYSLAPGNTAVVTLGSVGQPREDRAYGNIAVVTQVGLSRTISLEFVSAKYDVQAHVASIQRAALSAQTKAWLCAFFDSRP